MNYIDRYQELNKNAVKVTMQPDSKQIDKPMIVFNGFIGDETIIKPYSNPNSGFKLDDEKLYSEFINIASLKERNFAEDIQMIQNYIDKYFGDTNDISKVKDANPNIHSISKYQNNGGECIHKSAVANNLLQILGYDCEMVWSNIGSENHAFLIIHNQDKHFIYDPANRSRLYAYDTQFYKIPTLVEKSQEDIDKFYDNSKPIAITDEDERLKNLKQTNQNYKIVLPKLTYDCRKKTQFISLKKQKDVVDEYVEHLKNKGLGKDEICNILKKIEEEAAKGIKPKVESLNDVYDAMKTR